MKKPPQHVVKWLACALAVATPGSLLLLPLWLLHRRWANRNAWLAHGPRRAPAPAREPGERTTTT